MDKGLLQAYVTEIAQGPQKINDVEEALDEIKPLMEDVIAELSYVIDEIDYYMVVPDRMEGTIWIDKEKLQRKEIPDPLYDLYYLAAILSVFPELKEKYSYKNVIGAIENLENALDVVGKVDEEDYDRQLRWKNEILKALRLGRSDFMGIS